MRSSSNISSDYNVEAEASAWIAQIESGNFRKKDVRAFRDWIDRSPCHAQAVRRYARIWDELNILAELQRPLDAEVKRANALAEGGGTMWRKLAQGAAAAAFVALCAVAAVFFVDRSDSIRNPSFLASTAIGELKTVALPDGSVININTDSQLEANFSRRERKVRILKGEALFDVAHDAHRPFVVYAGMQSVRAIGTSFSVRLHENDVQVMVAKGRVEVSRHVAEAPQGREVRLSQSTASPVAVLIEGQTAELAAETAEGPAGPIRSVGAEEIDRRLAWRRGELVFAGEPLGVVVAEIARYSEIEFSFADPTLTQLPVGGVFKIGETDALFEVLKESFGIEIRRLADSGVLLVRGETDQAG